MTAFTSATTTPRPGRASRSGRLAGRRVLVTGASRGIGQAIALRYADEGADLCLAATTLAGLAETQAQAEARGAQVVALAVDVADRAAVQSMVDTMVARMGGIDVLVNNAGVYHAASLLDTTPEDFDRVMQVNLYGAFHVLQLCLRQMRAQGAGKGGSLNQSAYNASKHALVGLTRCAAAELGPLGICINAICPGFVETDMLQNFSAHSAITGLSFEQILANGRARVPLRRFLQPVEIAHLAVYLGSAESDGMTGQSILLDGGMLMV